MGRKKKTRDTQTLPSFSSSHTESHSSAAGNPAYPPALLLLLACAVLLLKALHADMLCTRLERDVRRLNQRLALLELAQQEATPSPNNEENSL